jgi:4-amino-4-deoxy-L-arabinose transferase-like glycosyltransferase
LIGKRKPVVIARGIRYLLFALYVFAAYHTLLLSFDLAARAATPLQSFILALEPFRVTVIGLLCLALITVAWLLRRAFAERLADDVAALLNRATDSVWLVACIVFGAILRLLWYLVFPAPQTNDGAAYLQLAVRLVHGETYFLAGQLGGYAFWPPGMPFLLVPGVALVGPANWLPLAINLVLFCIAVLASYGLGLRLVGRVATRFAVLLLAVWPGFVFASGLVEKELILVALLPLALYLYLRGTESAQPLRHNGARLLAGALVGFCALTQPSTALLPLLFMIHDLWIGAGWRRAGGGLILLLAGVALIVLPWTARNAMVFGELVPIATNGGNSFYTGNNAKALGNAADTGGYVSPDWTLDWRDHNDLQRGRYYAQQAKQWILQNPGDFARLTVKRVALIVGDDSDGVFRTLRLGLGVESISYVMLKAFANAFWLAVIVFTLPLFLDHDGEGQFALPLVLLGSMVLYFVALHGVVEGGSRHHIGTLWCYALFAATSLLGVKRQPNRRTA